MNYSPNFNKKYFNNNKSFYYYSFIFNAPTKRIITILMEMKFMTMIKIGYSTIKIKAEIQIATPYSLMSRPIDKNNFINNDKPFLYTNIVTHMPTSYSESGYATTPKQIILQIKKCISILINDNNITETNKKEIVEYYKKLHRNIVRKLSKKGYVHEFTDIK